MGRCGEVFSELQISTRCVPGEFVDMLVLLNVEVLENNNVCASREVAVSTFTSLRNSANPPCR